MNQLEFKVSGGGGSQAERILSYLQMKLGAWVGMPDLAMGSGSWNVHSRISDLRKRGHSIEQKTERQPDGTNHSFYKLT